MTEKNKRLQRVAIVVPSGDMIHTDFALSLIATIKAMADAKLADMALINTKGSILPKSRHETVRNALEMGSDKIFFIDSDMKFMPQDFYNLLCHKKDFVSGVCTMRRDPPEYVARDKERNIIDFDGKDGLIEVHTTGLAFACVNAEVFTKLPEPWFKFEWEDTGGWIGEDTYFCRELDRIGVKRFVDASVRVKHIGTKDYCR